MPLRITLKPFERMIINGAAIRNGDRNANFIVETQCRFLRETDIVYESEADTPCKKLYITLQVVHLSENPAEPETLFFAQAVEVMKIIPSSAPFLAEIQRLLAEKQTYYALKTCRQLITHEQEVLRSSRKKASAA